MTQAERKEATRARLMEAGAAVFGNKGFHGASVEEVSERAGLSRGAFYAHFPDKQELFLALLDRMIDQTEEHVGSLAREDRAPGALLEGLSQVRIGMSRGDSDWLLVYGEFRLQALRDPELRPRLAAHHRKLKRVLGQIIERELGLLGVPLPAPAADLATIVIALDEGLSFLRQVDPRGVRADLLLESLALLLRAATALGREASDA